jgi:hypothetical protein
MKRLLTWNHELFDERRCYAGVWHVAAAKVASLSSGWRSLDKDHTRAESPVAGMVQPVGVDNPRYPRPIPFSSNLIQHKSVEFFSIRITNFIARLRNDELSFISGEE